MNELVLDKYNKLPEGWINISLKVILNVLENGSRPKGGVQNISKGIPSISGEHLTYDGQFNFKKLKFIPKSFYDSMTKGKIKLNDILIVKDGATTGKVSLVTSEFLYPQSAINEHVFLLRGMSEIILQTFLFYFILSSKGQEHIKKKSLGLIGGINTSFVDDFQIPFPSLNEQKRIVEKIEKLFLFVDFTKQTLEKTKSLLKQYRSSILKFTFEGKFITQDPNDEPSSILLEKIRHKKSSKSSIRANSNAVESILEKNNLPESWTGVELDNIPETWEIVELQQITKITDSLHVTPKYSSQGIPMVRSTEIKYGDLNLEQAFRVSKEIYDTFTRNYKPIKNDIVMSRVGTYFVTSFVNTDEIFCMGQNTLVIHPMINPLYLYYVLNSKFINKQIEKKLVGTSGQRTISLKNIKELLIFLPPLNEQKRIVDKIEENISMIRNNEERIDLLLLHINSMKNIILKQAFEGKLVQQDPNDEPAEILLEKIKEKQLIQKQKTSRRKKNVK